MTNPALMFNEVVEKLKTTVQEGRSFDAAQVKLVGLENVREAAGENWARIKERVRTNSMSFLQGCLGLQDIVIPAGDGFLVIYADESHRDIAAEQDAAGLAQRLLPRRRGHAEASLESAGRLSGRAEHAFGAGVQRW